MKNVFKVIGLIGVSASLAACSGMPSFNDDHAGSSQNEYGQTQTHGVANSEGFNGESLGSGYGPGVPANLRSSVEALPRTINFGFNQYTLNHQGAAIAKQNAAFLLQHPKLTVLIAGNTDPRGSVDYNLHLGQRRADAVEHYLAAEGVAQNQLCTISYGESRPAKVASDLAQSQAYAQDRRAELVYGESCAS